MKGFILAVFCMTAVVGPALGAPPETTSLAGLIQAGNRKTALDRIRTGGADVNEAQPDGTRPIHWAVYRVDYEVLDALIAKKAKVDVTNEFGSTPLAEAVKLADARMVKTLLGAGAPVEGANQDGETALMLAIKTAELPIVEMLVKAGANVNTVEKFQNQTPLMWAAAAPKNAAEMVKLLLSKGADVKPRALYTDWPNQISSEPRAQYRPVGGLTALLYAARNGCYDCVESLLGAGADVNVPSPEGVTPLMVALDNDHNDVARLLLDRGANPTISDWWGRTALYITIDRKESAGGGRGGAGGRGGGVRGGAGGGGGRGSAAASRGSGPAVSGREAQARQREASSGEAQARQREASNMDIVNTLLAADVDPNPELNMHRPSRGGNSGRFAEEQLNTGCTPLFRATQAGDMEVIRALLARGANPNINAMGFTPFLLAAGVDPGGRGGGGAPNTTLLDLMIQHGADVNAQVTGTRTYSMRISYHPPPDKEGASALHEAVQAGRTDLVRYLLEKGASPELVDANGKKPIDLVAAGGNGGNGGGRGRGGAPPPDAAGGNSAARGAGGRGGAGGGGVNPAAAAEIRAMLQTAASKK
ncbi:MAG TPA: ankyrin repeat domain-containing protein [Terriglobia bacterium]